jgi:arginyl-tRNA synthetase
MPNVQRLLEQKVEAAIAAAFPEAGEAPVLLAPAQDAKFGDYQANGAMALAKRLGKKPREVADAIVERLDVADLAEKPEIAGPGFINFRLKNDWVGRELGRINPDDRLGVETVERPETVVVDYSAPNLAKEMHVGHLRSTIIGDALVRMLEFAGHKVIRQNHVGDWGTQFGMLLAFIQETAWDESPQASQAKMAYSLGELEEFYRLAKQRFDADPTFAAKAQQCIAQLQGAALDPDRVVPEHLRWKNVRDHSMLHARLVYERLGVLLKDDDIRGESAYNDDLPRIMQTLRAKVLLTESQGAQCVFLNGPDGKPLFVNKEGEPLPLIVQKSDEGYLYATTDLAAIRYRVDELHANRILYVVDARQALHFRMVFECAYQAEFAKRGKHELVHVAFGTMMGPDGKPFKTREGGTVKLMDLLDEAEKRAYTLVTAKNAEDVAAGRTQPLSDDQKKDIAHKVGIGAVKYADLAQNRTSDYVFSWEKMLSLAGNTAPYMQYAYARVRSIFRKGGEEAETHRADAGPIPLAAPEELALGKMLLRFPETLERALDGYQPNVVAAYLYDLAQAFTAFYEACPVLKSEEPVRAARLKLCDLVARTIAKGLDLLGIEVADRM